MEAHMEPKITDVTLEELIRQTDEAFAEIAPTWKGKKLSGNEKGMRDAWNGIFQNVAFAALGRVRDKFAAERFQTGA
jgi:hypothetical protein